MSADDSPAVPALDGDQLLTPPAPPLSSDAHNGTDSVIGGGDASTSADATAAAAADTIASGIASMSLRREESLRFRQVRHLDGGKTFTDAEFSKLPSFLLDSLRDNMRFNSPSSIQVATIPRILDGKNVIGQAQPGSGKTVAFTIGILNVIDVSKNTTQAICLTPTRELARQIMSDAVEKLSSHMPRKPTVLELIKGTPKPTRDFIVPQIVVGNTGSVKHWVKEGWLNVKDVKIFVLDEADEMVGIEGSQGYGFGKDTIEIKKKLPKSAQMLFFSATFTPSVLDFAKKIIGTKTSIIKLSGDDALALPTVFQVKVNCRPDASGDIFVGKCNALREIYRYVNLERSIVFASTRKEVDRIQAELTNLGLVCSSLHGDQEPLERDRNFDSFRNPDGDVKVLITSNVLARGVDVPSVQAVFQFNLPTLHPSLEGDHTSYLHRIGRCSRFGRRGVAINMMGAPRDAVILSQIEEKFGYKQGKSMCEMWDVDNAELLTRLATRIQEKFDAPDEEVVLDEVDDEVLGGGVGGGM